MVEIAVGHLGITPNRVTTADNVSLVTCIQQILSPTMFLTERKAYSVAPMPATRQVFKQCFCKECTEKGGTGVDGKPKGMLMDSRFLSTHLKHVQDECTPSLPKVLNDKDRPESGIDGLSTHLFTLTLTDNGPDPTTVPNKMWSSRADFQENACSAILIEPPPPEPTSISVSEIALSIDCLTS